MIALTNVRFTNMRPIDREPINRLCEQIPHLTSDEYSTFRDWLDRHDKAVADDLAEWRRQAMSPSKSVAECLRRLREPDESFCDLSQSTFPSTLRSPISVDLLAMQHDVQSLSLPCYEQFRRWIYECDSSRWNERIVEDVRNGVLDQDYGPTCGPLEWLTGEPNFMHADSSEFWNSFHNLSDNDRLLTQFAFEALKTDLYRVGSHLRAVAEFRFVTIGPRMLAFAHAIGQEWTWCWVGNRPDYDLRFCRSL